MANSTDGGGGESPLLPPLPRPMKKRLARHPTEVLEVDDEAIQFEEEGGGGSRVDARTEGEAAEDERMEGGISDEGAGGTEATPNGEPAGNGIAQAAIAGELSVRPDDGPAECDGDRDVERASAGGGGEGGEGAVYGAEDVSGAQAGAAARSEMVALDGGVMLPHKDPRVAHEELSAAVGLAFAESFNAESAEAAPRPSTVATGQRAADQPTPDSRSESMGDTVLQTGHATPRATGLLAGLLLPPKRRWTIAAVAVTLLIAWWWPGGEGQSGGAAPPGANKLESNQRVASRGHVGSDEGAAAAVPGGGDEARMGEHAPVGGAANAGAEASDPAGGGQASGEARGGESASAAGGQGGDGGGGQLDAGSVAADEIADEVADGQAAPGGAQSGEHDGASTGASEEPSPYEEASESSHGAGVQGAGSDKALAAGLAAASRSSSYSRRSKRPTNLPPGARELDPRSATQLLMAAQDAYRARDGKEAYRLASLSLSRRHKNVEARKLKVLAACLMKSRSTAKTLFNGLTSDQRAGLRSKCRAHGVRLGL